MTSRFNYISDLRPPAPFVHVTLRKPGGDLELANLPAQVDTGADRTVIPWRLVEALGLVQLDEIRIGSFGGLQQRFPSFAVQLEVRLLKPIVIEVLATEAEVWVLLGRDVLNRYPVLLDGPNLRLEIG